MREANFDKWITKEFEERIYDRFVQVEDSDLVLDLGCSKGYFYFFHQGTKKIRYIGVDGDLNCLSDFAQALEAKDDCVLLNLALAREAGAVQFESFFTPGKVGPVLGITWRDLVRLIGRRIDFLKFDIETWEACLWDTEVAYELFKANVGKFTGELHLGYGANPDVLGCLQRLKNDPGIEMKLFSVDGVDITASFWGKPSYYTEIIVSGRVTLAQTGTGKETNPFDRFYEGVSRRAGAAIRERVNVHYVEGPFVEILGAPGGNYDVEFIDQANGESFYRTKLARNHWTRANRAYFSDWRIVLKDEAGKVTERRLDLKDQRVFVCLDSKALGDTIAWFPFAVEFWRQHGCKLIVSTFWNELFRGAYPTIEFVEPGVTVPNLMAKYVVGCRTPADRNLSPWPWYEQPLQDVAAGILGLPAKELRPRIALPPHPSPVEGRYVCIATESTAAPKEWQRPGGWEAVTDWLVGQGFRVVNVSRGGRELKGVQRLPTGPIERVISYLQGCQFFIGLPSGLSWLAWALQKPVVMISGFSPPWVEFQGGRVHVGPPSDKCQGCYATYDRGFDNQALKFCPRMGGTSRQFECTRSITSEAVIEALRPVIATGQAATFQGVAKVLQEG